MIRSYKVEKTGIGKRLTTSLFLLFQLLDHVDAALHVEFCSGNRHVAIQNFFETRDCFRNRNILALIAGENSATWKGG